MNLKKLFFDTFASRIKPLEGQIIRPIVVAHEGDKLRKLLATKTSTEVTDYELRTIVESNLWMLTPEAFLYFIPTFLHASLQSYESVSVFASELISALTEPSRADVIESLDKLAECSHELVILQNSTNILRKKQLEWFDSGIPTTIFHERFDNLTNAEGAAVLTFLIAFQEAHGADFPFDEVKNAIDRYWSRYRIS